jgi:flagellar assembly factor FliW
MMMFKEIVITIDFPKGIPGYEYIRRFDLKKTSNTGFIILQSQNIQLYLIDIKENFPHLKVDLSNYKDWQDRVKNNHSIGSYFVADMFETVSYNTKAPILIDYDLLLGEQCLQY